MTRFLGLNELFKARHFGREVVVLACDDICVSSSATAIWWGWWRNAACRWLTPPSCAGSSIMPRI